MKKIPIHNAINDVNLWYGIADSHDTFPYMLCELCDDSISSMVANQTEQREIAITLQECAAENGQGAVSYTHLDVYKRQGPGGKPQDQRAGVGRAADEPGKEGAVRQRKYSGL